MARIRAVPFPMPSTSPSVPTCAISGFSLAHVTVRPLTSPPPLTSVCAVNCTRSPLKTAVSPGITITWATGSGVGTVSPTDPLMPSTVAVTDAYPGASALTSPVAVIDATPLEVIDQVTFRPGSC